MKNIYIRFNHAFVPIDMINVENIHNLTKCIAIEELVEDEAYPLTDTSYAKLNDSNLYEIFGSFHVQNADVHRNAVDAINEIIKERLGCVDAQ